MAQPRKKEVSVIYNGVEVWKDISPYLSSFRYDDATDSSDTISLDFSDRDLKWSNSWMPQKQDKISPSIVLKNWDYEGDMRTFICGDFIVDDFSFSGYPVACQINGISAPVNTEFKETKNHKTWEAATVRLIAQEIANKYGLNLVYDIAGDIKVAKTEQDEQTDSDFLNKICSKYGLGIKVYAARLVIWSYEEYFAKPISSIIKPNTVQRWSYRSTTQGTYTGARVTYTNPKSKKKIDILVGKEGRLCNINEKADNEADAILIGKNAILNANRKETTMSVTLTPSTGLFATTNVQVEGFGKIDGKYFVEKVSHNFTPSNYSIQASLSAIPKEE